jgi:hypothetical protein
MSEFQCGPEHYQWQALYYLTFSILVGENEQLFRVFGLLRTIFRHVISRIKRPANGIEAGYRNARCSGSPTQSLIPYRTRRWQPRRSLRPQPTSPRTSAISPDAKVVSMELDGAYGRSESKRYHLNSTMACLLFRKYSRLR